MYGLLIKLHNTRNRKQNQCSLVINEKSIIQLSPVIKFMLKAMDFYILQNMYKNLSSTCDSTKEPARDALKTSPDRTIQKTAEATGEMVGSKIAEKITKVLPKLLVRIQANCWCLQK